MTTLQDWSLFPVVMDLFVSKCNEWKGFVDDELIESVLVLSERTNFTERSKVAKVILSYFDFAHVFDERAVVVLLDFISDRDIGKACLEELTILLSQDLNTEQKQFLCTVIENSMPDICEIIEQDDSLSPSATLFLQKFDDWCR